MLVIKGSALKCAALYLATPFSFNVSITSLDAGNVLSGSYLYSASRFLATAEDVWI